MPRYKPEERVSCLHCRTTVKLEKPSRAQWGDHWATVFSPTHQLHIAYSQCPSCLQFIVAVDQGEVDPSTGNVQTVAEYVLWPKSSGRDPVPQEVPSHIAQDYTEAALVLEISSKASAALSRRCLQTVLREAAQTKARDLNDQIDEVMPTLPSRIAENLDAVRVIGNFAAHPIKSQSTGTVVDVEFGEAEWNLDMLDSLFDYYYVRPTLERKKREALNQKLKDAGKPPLK